MSPVAQPEKDNGDQQYAPFVVLDLVKSAIVRANIATYAIAVQLAKDLALESERAHAVCSMRHHLHANIVHTPRVAVQRCTWNRDEDEDSAVYSVAP
jgi:hypothetical protein